MRQPDDEPPGRGRMLAQPTMAGAWRGGYHAGSQREQTLVVYVAPRLRRFSALAPAQCTHVVDRISYPVSRPLSHRSDIRPSSSHEHHSGLLVTSSGNKSALSPKSQSSRREAPKLHVTRTGVAVLAGSRSPVHSTRYVTSLQPRYPPDTACPHRGDKDPTCAAGLWEATRARWHLPLALRPQPLARHTSITPSCRTGSRSHSIPYAPIVPFGLHPAPPRPSRRPQLVHVSARAPELARHTPHQQSRASRASPNDVDVLFKPCRSPPQASRARWPSRRPALRFRSSG